MLLFQAVVYWTLIFAHEEQQRRAWEQWERKAPHSLRTVRPVHWFWTATLHMVREALDPLTSAHINLAKYGGITAMSAYSSLVPFHISLRGGWKLGSLGNGLSNFLYGWISRVTRYATRLVSLTVCQMKHTSCWKIPSQCIRCLLGFHENEPSHRQAIRISHQFRLSLHTDTHFGN